MSHPRKILSLTAIAAAIAGLLAGPAALAGTQDFTIPTFEGDYYLSRDTSHISHLRVHEHLVAQFPETDQNHGILRAIPDAYDGHGLNLHVQSVTNDAGDPLAYTADTQNHNRVLKVGDANHYVHGLQAYNLDYTMDNVTTIYNGTQAHIWNVNGTGWQQVFGQVTAHLHLTSDLAAALQATDTRCYTGPQGSTASACTITTTGSAGSDTVTTLTATRPLEAGETLTYETHFADGTFVPYKQTAAELASIIMIALLLYILPILLTLGIVIRQWRKYGRDPRGRGVIIPQYLPPKELSAISSSALINEAFVAKAVSAQIIDLAVRHYLKIYEIKVAKPLQPDHKTYEIELIRDTTDLRTEELATINLIFPSNAAVGQKVKIDTLKNKLYLEAKALGKSVNRQLAVAGYFRSDPESAKAPYVATGSALLVFTFFFWRQTVSLLVPGLILLIASKFMPARTQTGVQLRDYLLGLKAYMKLAEADRIKVLQSPHGELTEKIDVSDNVALVKLCEKLLPYAMLFGIEKDWAKEFAGLYTQSPDWYSGPSGFSSGYFAGSIANFSAASTASFTPPASSGSGSGGGFAGGGGGGGGGGGW